MDHQSMPYENKVFEDVPAADCNPQPIVDGTEYSVACPACFGHFSVQDFNGTYRVRIFGRRESRPAETVPVVCECGFDHPDRPAEETFYGCGAAWRLTR